MPCFLCMIIFSLLNHKKANTPKSIWIQSYRMKFTRSAGLARILKSRSWANQHGEGWSSELRSQTSEIRGQESGRIKESPATRSVEPDTPLLACHNVSFLQHSWQLRLNMRKNIWFKIVAFNPKQGRAFDGKKNPISHIESWGFVFLRRPIRYHNTSHSPNTGLLF